MEVADTDGKSLPIASLRDSEAWGGIDGGLNPWIPSLQIRRLSKATLPTVSPKIAPSTAEEFCRRIGGSCPKTSTGIEHWGEGEAFLWLKVTATIPGQYCCLCTFILQ